jgi:uncharacterized protein YecT (DUF1311 family)
MSDAESTGTCMSCSNDTYHGSPICDACSEHEEANAIAHELEQVKAKCAAYEAAAREHNKQQRSLLTAEQLMDFDEDNSLLKADGEEQLSVAEYLKCRLDDANERIAALEAREELVRKLVEVAEDAADALEGEDFLGTARVLRQALAALKAKENV